MNPRVVPIVATQADQRVYARSVRGWFSAWRWAMVWATQLLFYGLPWLQWQGRQAVLFDLEARRFHVFALTFAPQDFILLTLLLAISALSLFLFTAVAGRLWCGYACPQTVYSSIFQWIERQVEGDRGERIRRDRGPRSAAWLARKSGKHALWLAVALLTGFTFVGYFTPIRTLAAQSWHLALGPWQTFWVLFYGLATYGNAGWLREKVCKYMCPYARFQGVMYDEDTLAVAYDASRGEPRGPVSKQVSRSAAGLGDCVDCTLCVQVCPTGIDIRRGLQYECIGCALCIDACNGVMDKLARPRGLIRYGTGSGLSLKDSPRAVLARLRRPRVVIYTALLWTLIAILVAAVWQHVPLRAEVLRDRAVMMRPTEDGGVENVYRLHLTNTSERPMPLRLDVHGLPGLALPDDEATASVPPQGSLTLVLHARLPADADVGPGSHPIVFTLTETGHDGISIRAESSFIARR